MSHNLIHSIVVCLAALALPLMVACSSHEDIRPDEAPAGALYINVATIGQSRAGTAGMPEMEMMSTVRVVVLHADGTVEHNRHFSLQGPGDKKYILLKVKPCEAKKIFLFANEESVASIEGSAGSLGSLATFFNGFGEDDAGFAEAVTDLHFEPDYSEDKPIPMSSMYDIVFPENGSIEETFYVVRVATKFTVNLENLRYEQVKVNSLTVDRHADRNYLLARVNDSEQNRALFNGKTWIDWLRQVSDASSVNDDYAVTEAAGWLKDYELPATADRTLTYTHDSFDVMAADPATHEPGKTQAVFYLPESINLKNGEVDGGEQEYTLTFDIDGTEAPFTFKLPNLKALFRNTHVVVNITLEGSEILFKVTVEPWVPGGRSEIDVTD